VLKKVLSSIFLLSFCLFFIFPPKVLAQVVINEFSSSSDPEWVELYNPTDQTVSLNNLVLFFDDKPSTTQKLSFCQGEEMIAKTFKRIVRPNGSHWLANDGDSIILKREDDIVETISYGEGQPLKAPSAAQSASRNPDGGSEWIILNTPTPQGDIVSFECPTPTPTPSPTPEPTDVPEPTATPTPRPPTATPKPPPPTIKPTLTSSPSPTASEGATILGESFGLTGTPTEEPAKKEGKPLSFLPVIFIFLGVALIGGSLYLYWRARQISDFPQS
jgi:hypothetical protein